MARKQGSETVSIHADWWDASETVEILASMTHGIKKQIEADLMSFMDTSGVNPNNPDSMKDVKIDLKKAVASGDDLKLLLFIKSWSLANADGSIMVIDRESLDSLAEEDIAFINDEIDKRNASNVTQEQRDAFLLSQSSGTTAAIPAPSLLPGG